MNYRSIFSRYILLPLGKTYSRRNFLKALRYKRKLEKSQYYSRKEIENIRNEKFKKLVSHCYENVPYYRKFMDDNNLRVNDFTTIHDIKKFPLMTKKILRKYLNELRATNFTDKMVRQESTGNTTGEPIQFFRDLTHEYIVDANNWRFEKYAGYLQGMPVALFWANLIEVDNINKKKEKLKELMNNTKMLNFFNITSTSLDQYISYLNKSKPCIIRGYASGIYLFVQYCMKKGRCLNYIPKCLILTSDKIYEYQKKKISAFFNCEIYEEYGCREFSFLAYECQKHDGLHLAEELFVFEVLDNYSHGINFEGKGEIIVTPLHNYAMPLIRYRLGDEVNLSSDYCSCGRKLKLISDIEGKITDFVVTKSGKLIWGSYFACIMYESKGIDVYQINQDEVGKIDINIVINEEFEENEISILKKKINNNYGGELDMHFNFVNNIKISSSGKRRSVVSKLAKEYIPE